MPDLNQMQVKVGIHESMVDRMHQGMKANVTLNRNLMAGEVTYVASVAAPAGWWTGNQVRYDTLVSLPAQPNLRPGMSADVVITVAEHQDVLLLPVAALVERDERHFCWVQRATNREPSAPVRTEIQIGDSNDVFSEVKAGLQEGDVVMLNPVAYEPISSKTSKSEIAAPETPPTEPRNEKQND